jgi:hypothetical protein
LLALGSDRTDWPRKLSSAISFTSLRCSHRRAKGVSVLVV